MLPPGAGAERAGRAHAAPARRARDAVHRPGVPRARSRRWRSASCAPSRRSATRRSRTACRATPSSRTGCAPVLAVIYLVFNEGYTATEGDELDPRRPLRRGDPARAPARRADARRARGARAARAAPAHRVATRRAHRARRHRSCCSPTRTARSGTATLIAEGQAIVRRCLRRNQPGPYQIQAAINAVHSDAPTAADTDWRQVRRSSTTSSSRSRRVRSSRSTARSRVAELEGPRPALAAVDALDLDGYHLFHATRAELLGRLGPRRRRAPRLRPRPRTHEQRLRARAARTKARSNRLSRVGRRGAAARHQDGRAGGP